MAVHLHEEDLPAGALGPGPVAVDTETMGLQTPRDRLCLVQISDGGGDEHLVRFAPGSDYAAPNLRAVLADPGRLKLYHFARFDLAAIKHYIGVMAAPVYCTKIASRLIRTYTDRHGLKELVRELCGQDISKQQQSSDWGAPELSEAQRDYAASDVRFLHAIRERLDERLAREGRAALAQACFDFLPARAELDLAGWPEVDIFAHICSRLAVSTLAREQRRERRRWAMAGGSHDRLMALLRILLPVAIGALAAFLAVAPLTVGRDISFMLSKDRVDIAPERMRVSRAVYRGRDVKGEPFQLTARSAVQQNSQTPIVHLQTLDARIRLTGGPATIVAGRGRYDMDTDRIALDGPVRMDDATGYTLLTRDILFDMKSKVATSRGRVDGTMPLGTFAADRMRADLDGKVVDLVGRAHLHIVQRRARGAR